MRNATVAQRDQPVSLLTDGDRTLVTAAHKPMLWARRSSPYSVGGRGLLGRNEVTIVEQPAEASGADEILLGLSSTPISIESRDSAAAVIPANEVWAVPLTREWRCTIDSATDLRLVVLNDSVVRTSRQIGACLLFSATEGQVMLKMFLRQVTPAWVDREARYIDNVAMVDHKSLIGVKPTADVHSRATASAFASTVNWWLSRAQDVHETDSKMGAALDFIDDNLSDRELTTDKIAHAVYLSRRALQHLFEQHGGVATYIRKRRAEAARSLITATGATPDLDLIAKVTGLGSRRTLERAIRREYSVTPSQLRALDSNPLTLPEPRRSPREGSQERNIHDEHRR